MDWRRTMREFVRAARPADAAAVAAAKLRRRVHESEAGATTAAGAAAMGGGFGDGDGGGGGGGGGGLQQHELQRANQVESNNNFTDLFSNFLNPWWSNWKGQTPIVEGGVFKYTTNGSGIIGHVAAYNAASFTDVEASAIVTAGTTRAMVFARGALALGELSGYSVQAGATLRLQRVDAGAITDLATDGLTGFAVGDRLGIECVGTTVKLLKNGTQVLSAVDATYTDGFCGLAKRTGTGTTSFGEFTVAG